MKRMIIATEENPRRWKDIMNIEEYDLERIRKWNVNVTSTNNWLKAFEMYDIHTPGDVNLYALELSYRGDNRYQTQMLPNVPGNPLSGYRYYFAYLEPSDEFSYDNHKEMIEHIISKIRPTTLDKWRNPFSE